MFFCLWPDQNSHRAADKAIPLRLEFVPYPLLAGLAILAAILFIFRQRGRRPAYLFCFSLFWLYLLLIVSMIVFPIPLPQALGWTRQPAAHILSRVNLAPFSFGGLFSSSPRVIFDNLVGNILLTLPFGLGIPFLARLPARRIPWLAAAVGLSLEASQLLVSLAIGSAYRGIDINDVLLNAGGVLLGYGFFRIFAWLLKLKQDFLRAE